MDSTAKEVSVEFPHLIRVYKDGSVERLFGTPNVLPSPEDPETRVASKDITISDQTGLSARLYLPKLPNPSTQKKLPILVYFHIGGFCTESAFSLLHHRYINLLASQAQVLVVSVEYRLAPEHPLPTAYEDCWAALTWVVGSQAEPDPWLAAHCDFGAVFVGGDSAGANIAHNIAMRAGSEKLANEVNLLGAFICHPYFLDGPQEGLAYKIWEFVYPNAPGGLNSYMVNPVSGEGAPSLAGLGCERVLVIVAEKDEIRDSGVRYYEAVRESGFGGQVELFEIQGEGHCFQIFNSDTHNAKLLFQRLASFLRK